MSQVTRGAATDVTRVAVLGRLAHVAASALDGIPVRLDVLERPEQLEPSHDLALCLSYPRLVPAPLLEVPRFGVFVPHASDLPSGRGWAPVNWALIREDPQLWLTTFRAVAACDAGPIYRKSSAPLTPTDTIETAYAKVMDLMRDHIRSLVLELRAGAALQLTPQVGSGTWNPRRTPAHSELSADATLAELWPLLRACHNSEYPAFFRLHGKRIVLRYEVVDDEAPAPPPRRGSP